MSDKPSTQQIQQCLIRATNSYNNCISISIDSKGRCLDGAIDNYQKRLIETQQELTRRRKNCDEDNTDCLSRHWKPGSGSGQVSNGVGSVGVWGFISEEDRKNCEKSHEECYKKAQEYSDDSISNAKDGLSDELQRCDDSYQGNLSQCLNLYDENRTSCINSGYMGTFDAFSQLIDNITSISINPSGGGIPVLLPHSVGERGLFRGRSVFD